MFSINSYEIPYDAQNQEIKYEELEGVWPHPTIST